MSHAPDSSSHITKQQWRWSALAGMASYLDAGSIVALGARKDARALEARHDPELVPNVDVSNRKPTATRGFCRSACGGLNAASAVGRQIEARPIALTDRGDLTVGSVGGEKRGIDLRKCGARSGDIER